MFGRKEEGVVAALNKAEARFIALSGIGWLLDTAVQTSVLALADLSVLIASVAGGLCGATFAFLTSSRHVFGYAGGGVGVKLILYLGYTILVIFFSAALIEYITKLIVLVFGVMGLAYSTAVYALFAKCIVTPFTLFSNFLMSRMLLSGSPR